MINNTNIIIRSVTINYHTDNLDVFCHLPVSTAVGNSSENKNISFLQTQYLPSPVWSDEDLKNALSSITNIPAEKILFFNELDEQTKIFLNRNTYTVRSTTVNF